MKNKWSVYEVCGLRGLVFQNQGFHERRKKGA